MQNTLKGHDMYELIRMILRWFIYRDSSVSCRAAHDYPRQRAKESGAAKLARTQRTVLFFKRMACL